MANRPDYMKLRITEGKKPKGSKHLDSSNQPTARQKGYAKGLKEQSNFMEGTSARKYVGDLTKTGFSSQTKLPNLNPNDTRLENKTYAQGRNQGRIDMGKAKEATLNKKPSEMTAEEIAAIRDANSTKATMGEGKPMSPIDAGKKLYEGMKNIVQDSMARTIQSREENKENYKKTKTK